MQEPAGLHWLLDALPDAVLLCDAAGVIRYSNGQCVELLGYAPGELHGCAVEILVPGGLREMHRHLRESYQQNPRSRPMSALQDIVVVRKDGARHPVTIALNPLQHGSAKLTVVSLRDNAAAIEARRKEREFYERALRTQRMENLGVLSCGIAHDFKNLLCVVMGNADLALEQLGEGTTPLHGQLGAIQAAVQHLQELSHQILSYATGREASPRLVDINESVGELETLVKVTLPANTTLRCELASAVPALQADPGQIFQVLLNLILNARDALASSGGCITVRTGVDAEHVFLEVEDDGYGIDEGTRAQIFDPFFTTKAGGKGLGLSVVDSIVKKHGGFIHIRSAANAGATFRVHLPRS